MRRAATIMNENGRNNLSGADYAYSVPLLPVLLRYGLAAVARDTFHR